MGWTLTSAAARLANRVRGAEPSGPDASEPAPGTLFSRAFERAVDRAGAADAKALEVAHGQLEEDSAVIERAVASGAPVSAVAALAASWAGLGREARGMAKAPCGTRTGPVRWGSVAAAQVDQTTCGAAVMGMMRMMGDPFVAVWVATGRSLGGYTPAEAVHVEAAGYDAHTVEERWQALQRVLHAQTTSSALGPVAWPRSLGTPPWKVDDRTRFAGLRFAGRLVDDSTPEALAPVLAHARRALADGIPVPMFTAGDSSLGLSTVIPRHVVLLVRDAGDGFHVYEPGAGAVLTLADSDLRPGAGRLAALGHWSRAAWLVMPVRARRG